MRRNTAFFVGGENEGHKRRKSKERKKKRKKKERRKKKEKKQKGDGHARKIGGRNEDKRNLRHCEGRPNKRNEGITIKSAATECRRCQTTAGIGGTGVFLFSGQLYSPFSLTKAATVCLSARIGDVGRGVGRDGRKVVGQRCLCNCSSYQTCGPSARAHISHREHI